MVQTLNIYPLAPDTKVVVFDLGLLCRGTCAEKTMNQFLTVYGLWRENKFFQGTGGVSRGNRQLRFEPAFRDAETGTVYRSCHGDGSPAPCHLLDGLPPDLAVARDGSGRITAVKGSVVAGFVREGRFYTREEAALAVANQPPAPEQPAKVRWLFRH